MISPYFVDISPCRFDYVKISIFCRALALPKAGTAAGSSSSVKSLRISSPVDGMLGGNQGHGKAEKTSRNHLEMKRDVQDFL
jgi:hypothetical protein